MSHISGKYLSKVLSKLGRYGYVRWETSLQYRNIASFILYIFMGFNAMQQPNTLLLVKVCHTSILKQQ